jgi:hypothetical protein
MTSKNQSPKIDWLGFVVTSRAKSKIKFKLNEEKVKVAENGKEILQRRLKNWKIPFSDENIRKLLKQYKLKIGQDLYYLISTDKIDLAGVKECLTSVESVESQEEKLVIDTEKVPVQEYGKVPKTDDYLVIDDNVANVDYKLARCCNPIFGDEYKGTQAELSECGAIDWPLRIPDCEDAMGAIGQGNTFPGGDFPGRRSRSCPVEYDFQCIGKRPEGQSSVDNDGYFKRNVHRSA